MNMFTCDTDTIMEMDIDTTIEINVSIKKHRNKYGHILILYLFWKYMQI